MATFRKGKGIRRTDLRKSGARCVRYGELYTRYRNYVVDPISRIPEDVAATALQIEKGDLLFAGSGETAEEIGTCVAYIGDQPAYAGGDIIVLRAPRQDPVCLAHLMNAPEAVRQKARMAQGDAVVHIRGDHLAEVELPLPPLPEQRAIAAVLMDVDALMGSLEALVAKKRAVKQAAMQQLLTGRMRLPGFEGVWEVRRLRSDVSLLSGHHVMAHDSNVLGVGIPYLTGPADFPKGRIRHTRFTTKPMTVCRAGDILVTVKGSGSGTLVEADAEYCISRQLMAIRPTRWNSTFLRFSLLQNASRIRAASTGLIPGLSRSDILDQAIPIPGCEEEQRAIANILADMDAEIAALERRLDKTRAVKHGMMQQLLTGSIRLPIPDVVAANGPSR